MLIRRIKGCQLSFEISFFGNETFGRIRPSLEERKPVGSNIRQVLPELFRLALVGLASLGPPLFEGGKRRISPEIKCLHFRLRERETINESSNAVRDEVKVEAFAGIGAVQGAPCAVIYVALFEI